MALEIDSGEKPMPSLTADRRLYLTADKSTVVEEGDPTARFLLAGEGAKIPMPEVERLGLSMEDGRVTYDGQAVDAVPEGENSGVRVEQNGSWYTGYVDDEQVFKVQGEDAMKAAVKEVEG